jgi:hypothetical protein
MVIFLVGCNVAEQGPQSPTQQPTNSFTNPQFNQIVSFRHSYKEIVEGNTTVLFEVERTGSQIIENQIVKIKLSGTISPSDYSNITINSVPVNYDLLDPTVFEVPFTGFNLSETVEVNFVDDNIHEPDEMMLLQLVNNNNAYAIHPPTQMGIKVKNNDPWPVARFEHIADVGSSSLLAQNINEGTAGITINVILSHPSSQTVTVPVRISTQSVADSIDHNFTNQTLTFLPGEITKSVSCLVSCEIVNDSFNELTETLILELGSPTNALVNTFYDKYYINIIDTTPAFYQLTLSPAAIDEPRFILTTQYTGSATLASSQILSDATVGIFASVQVGDKLTITGGTNTNIGVYNITAVGGGNITLDAPIVSANSSQIHYFISRDTNKTATLTLTLVGNTSNAFVVPVVQQAISGNILPNVDYTLSSNSFYFPANSLSGASSTITVTALQDQHFEGAEVVRFSIGDTLYATADPGSYQVDLTINDGQTAPTVNFLASNYLTQEGSTFYLPIKLSAPSDSETVLRFQYGAGSTATAEPNANPDHSMVVTAGFSNNFSIPAGVSEFNYPIIIYNDAILDNNETIQLQIAVVSGSAVLGSQTATTITIKEAGSLATISFSSSDQTVEEGESAFFTINLSQPSEQNLTINLTMLDYSTTSIGSDIDWENLDTLDPSACTISGMTLTLMAGATSCDLSVDILTDDLHEPSEQMAIRIYQPNEISLGQYHTHTIYILDDSTPSAAYISFDNVSTVSQMQILEGNAANIYFHLDKPSGFDLHIPFSINTASTATLGEDFNLSTVESTIFIPKGSILATLTINTLQDNLYEIPYEEIIVDITESDNFEIGGNDSVTLTLINNLPSGETPVVIIPTMALTVDDPNDVNEADVPPIAEKQLTLTLSAPLTYDLVVPLQISGSGIINTDYTLSKQHFTIPAGATDDTIVFDVLDDEIYDGDHTMFFSIQNINGVEVDPLVNQVDFTIYDNEALPAIGFAPSDIGNTPNLYNADMGSAIGDEKPFYIPISVTPAAREDITVEINVLPTTTATNHGITSSIEIIIPAGATYVDYTLPFAHDALQAGNLLDLRLAKTAGPGAMTAIYQDIQITMVNAPSLENIGIASGNSLTINEGDSANIVFTRTSTAVQEIILKVNQDTSSPKPLLESGIPLNIFSTATIGCAIIGDALEFGPTVSSCTVTIDANDDLLYNEDRTVRIAIQQPSNHFMNENERYVDITITNNEIAPTASISVANSNLIEGENTYITFNLDNPAMIDTIINFEVDAASSAIADSDYVSFATSTVTIPAGASSATLNLFTISDTFTEGPEDLIIRIVAGVGYLVDAVSYEETIMIDDASLEDLMGLPVLTIAEADPVVPLEVNENDIVNVAFELSYPTVKDITVNFKVDETAGDCGILPEPKCAVIYTDVANSDSPALALKVDSMGNGSIIIPKGTTRAVLSFLVKQDYLFELGEKERFGITIDSFTYVDDSDPLNPTVEDADGMYAQLDTQYETILIDINDIDQPPVAFFANPKFKTHSEANANLLIPVFLTNASELPSTIKVQIIQSADNGYFKADERDFVGYGNLTDGVTNAHDGAPAYPNALYTYSGVDNIIFEGILTIPALETMEEILLNINNDVLYEGNEQFLVRVINDPLEPWATVNQGNNEYRVTILESQSFPKVSFDMAAETASEDSTSPGDVIAADFADLNSTYVTVYNKPISITAVSQHQDVSFKISFSGSANISPSYFNDMYEFMYGDYFVGIYSLPIQYLNGTSDFVVNYTTGELSVTVPAGSTELTADVQFSLANDYRYEPDNETIILQLNSFQNIVGGNNIVHTHTILDDDVKPILFIKNTPPTNVYEYEQQAVNISVADIDQYFWGHYITQKDFEVQLMTRSTRHDNSLINNTKTISLNGTNQFDNFLSLNHEYLGIDPRRIKALRYEFYLASDDHVELIDDVILTPYYLDPGLLYTAGATYAGTFNVRYEDLKVALSRDSKKHTVNSSYYIEGHTCTTYRGIVSCFGLNSNGQLGRGDTQYFGKDEAQDITTFTNSINLGVDQFGNRLYVTELALGALHTCALFNTNEVKCWGDNSYGQLGRGDSFSNIGTSASQMGNNLVSVNLGTNAKVLSIHAMDNSTCAVLDDGRAKCWGRNNKGQLGNSSTLNYGSNIALMGENLPYVNINENILKMTTGSDHVCALTELGGTKSLRCWGDNSNGQLGLNVSDAYMGGTPSQMSATSVQIDNIDDITLLQAGKDHTCVSFDPTVITSYNTRCWGNNYYAQLGIGRLNRAGMYLRNNDLVSYNSAAASCSYHTSSGNNCTLLVGKQQPSYDPSYPYVAIEELTLSGHEAGANYILRKPSNATSGSNTINVGITKNQFVQLYYPVYSLAAGETYTCGVVKTTFGIGPALTVRCWGSNYIWKGADDVMANQVDQGILNNHGHSAWYNPLTDGAHTGFFNTPGTPSSGCTTGTGWNNNVCNFVSHFKVIGDDSALGHIYEALWPSIHYTNGNIFTHRWYRANALPALSYGYTSGFPGAGGVSLNHEMHSNSHSKWSFAGKTDIKIVGGNHHVCALPKVNNNNYGASRTLQCWGNNYAGQLGINWTHHTGCIPNYVGGMWSCGSGNGETKDFTNYNLNFQ